MIAENSRAASAGCALLLAFAAVSVVTAHPDLDRQIRDLTLRIESDAGNPTLWIQRGQLHRIHRDWDLAESDFLRARKIQPDLDVVDYFLGGMKLEADQPKQARKLLDRFLARHPDHARALVARARTYARLDRPLSAAEDYTQALAAFDRDDQRPDPAYYLERSRALVAAGPQYAATALNGINEGLARWGPTITLELHAVELERTLGRHDAALARVDRLAAGTNRQETWLVRRGDILVSAGRKAEARAAYGDAVEAIESLPSSRRASRAMQELGERARAAIEQLDETATAGMCWKSTGPATSNPWARTPTMPWPPH